MKYEELKEGLIGTAILGFYGLALIGGAIGLAQMNRRRKAMAKEVAQYVKDHIDDKKDMSLTLDLTDLFVNNHIFMNKDMLEYVKFNRKKLNKYLLDNIVEYVDNSFSDFSESYDDYGVSIDKNELQNVVKSVLTNIKNKDLMFMGIFDDTYYFINDEYEIYTIKGSYLVSNSWEEFVIDFVEYFHKKLK